jgi:hypothetical protein
MEPSVEVTAASGARTIEEGRAHVTAMERALRRCRALAVRVSGRTATAFFHVVVDARGRATAQGPHEDADDQVRMWIDCAAQALSRTRFARGGAGELDVRVTWSPAAPSQTSEGS